MLSESGGKRSAQTLPDKPTQLVLEPLPAVIAADVGPSRHCEYWFAIRQECPVDRIEIC
jgi:hypothetical protein